MTATRIEFHAVARALQLTSPVSQQGYRALASDEPGLYVLLIQSGIGAEKARKSTQQLLAKGSWDVIISTGFAGDLERDSIGSVLVGHEVFFWSIHDISCLHTTIDHVSSELGQSCIEC